MAANFTLPKEIKDVLTKMRLVHHLSVGQRTAECLVRSLNFVQTYMYYPRLADLAEEMETAKSGIARMEKDLQLANLILIEGRSRRTARFSKHIVVGQSIAAFVVIIAAQIEERVKTGTGIDVTDYDTLAHKIFEKYRASLELDQKERICKKLFENNYLDASGKFDFRRWAIDKFVFRALCLMGSREYNLPEWMTFERMPKSEGHELPDYGYVPESCIQNLYIGQSNSHNTMLISTVCPFCRRTNYVRTFLRRKDKRRLYAYYNSESILADVAKCSQCKMKFQIHISLCARFTSDCHNDTCFSRKSQNWKGTQEQKTKAVITIG